MVTDGLNYILDQSVEKLRIELREEGMEVVVSYGRRKASCTVNVREANQKQLLGVALGDTCSGSAGARGLAQETLGRPRGWARSY